MGNLIRDLKYTFRMMVKSPLFTVMAVVTLALGIGLNTAVFTAVHGLLLRPLAGTEAPDRLVQLYRQWPGLSYGSNSMPHFQDVRDRSGEIFENVASWTFAQVSLAADGRTERLMGLLASSTFFQTYGVDPMLGRPFLEEESVGQGEHAITILGHGFWESRFGGDRDIVGKTVQINGRPFEVVGVAPREFRGPMSVIDVPMYFPLMMQGEIMPGNNWLEQRGNNSLFTVARLHEGRTVEQARAYMDTLLTALRDEYPDAYDGQVGFGVVPQNEAGIHPSMRGAQVGMSGLMMAVVGVLLLIACVNVANLFLARARERRREMGIRLSLGGARGRIVRQLLTESLTVSLMGGLFGVGLAYAANKLIGGVKPPVDGPFEFYFPVDLRVLAFTFALSIGAGLLFGLVPALQSSSPELVQSVRGGLDSGWSRSRWTSALIIIQVALSLMLLICSGLFLRSLKGATEVDPGFDDPSSLVMASLDPGLQGYSREAASAFLDRLEETVMTLPEIESIGYSDQLPLGMGNQDRSVGIPGYEFAEGELQSLPYAQVREGFFETMGIRLVEGRTFDRTDTADSAPVIVINQQFAEHFWPGESALGRTVSTAGADRTVVGVVETGKYQSLNEAARDYMYLPHRDRFTFAVTLVARTRGNVDAALRDIRRVVRDLDADLPLYNVRTMQSHMGIALMPARLAGGVLGLFGVLGLLLAAVGIYGVMAYSVAQRQKELGIRVALGADQPGVVKMMLKEGLRLAAIGVAFGLVGAVAASRLVAGMLYNVSALDPVAFGAVPALLLAVAALAVYVPARRASKVDPISALKVS
ncbi:MAG: ABC transporter permease [Acidobacteriota bacterium]